MSASYTYSLKDDFLHGLNVKELRNEIQKNKIISAQCLGIKNDNHVDSDRVVIMFDYGLTGGEWRTLNDVVHSHIPMNMPELSHMMVKNVDKTTCEPIYEKLNQFIFPGAEFCHIKVNGNMDPEGGSWSIMIYDYDRHKKITEGTFTNTDLMIHDLGLACDIPGKDSTFEIFAKVANGSDDNDIKAYIHSIKLLFA